MIYLFDKDEKLIKIVRKSAVKTALQKYALTTERYVSDRLTVELKGLNADELEQVEYMAIQTMEDAHTFHYFYVAQKFSDELTTLIGVQSGIEELRKSPVYDKRPQNALARDVITDLLAGTNWQARFVGETTPHSTNFYYTSVFDALKKVCEVWDLEMQFFVEMNGNQIGARYIDFKQKIGQAVGKRVVYGHNALQILQEVERTNIFTALIGRGKGEEAGDGFGRKITFENVVWSTTQGKPVNKPAGQKYLELPLMTREYGIKNADGSMRPKIGFVDFSEEENPEILIERTYKALVDSARPQLTLKTSSVYLKGVKVGDTIRVVRHDKKLDYDTRIFEITFNRLNNQSSDIKLGDRIGESNEAKAQKIADKAVEQFVNNEFSNFVQNLPDYMPSADGFNNNWYGAEDPTVQYPGKVLINDIWYKPDPEHEGHKIMLRWSGEVWEEILRTYDSEALRDRIAEEIAQVNTSMQAQSEEHDRQVADILSKTQSIEDLANQAKTDAANAITEAIRLDTIERQATEEKVANAKSQAIAEANVLFETAKSLLAGQVLSVSTDLSQTKEAIKLLATRATVEALTGRVSSAESTLQVQAGEIASRVKTSDFDQAKQRISTAESSITQLGNRITTEISEVEGKIPTTVGGQNLIKNGGYPTNTQHWSYWNGQMIVSQHNHYYNGQRKLFSLQTAGTAEIIASTNRFEVKRNTDYTLSFYAFAGSNVKDSDVYFLGRKSNETTDCTSVNAIIYNRRFSGSKAEYVTVTFNSGDNDNGYIRFDNNGSIDGQMAVMFFGEVMLVEGTVARTYEPSPEEVMDEVKSVKTTITQTASGVEQLSTSLSTTNSKVTTAETKISQLISDVSSKVSQTDYNTLTGRVSSAETAITQNATEISKRLTSTQVESAITGKGYATVTALENKVKETADSFSRTISETKALIPSGESNLVKWGRPGERSEYVNAEIITHSFFYNGGVQLYVVKNSSSTAEKNIYFNRFVVERNTEYTLYFKGFNNSSLGGMDVWFLKRVRGSAAGFDSAHLLVANRKLSIHKYDEVVVTFNTGNYDEGYIRFDNNKSVAEGTSADLYFGDVSVKKGKSNNGWSPSVEELATVTALHNVTDTVDSHTRTIGAVGTTGSILDNVSKVTQTAAGLVQEVSGTNGLKTQVSQLAGSYAIKSLTKAGDVLGQINLNKDGSLKLDGSLVQITGKTYIQDSVISSAKIADLDAGKITTGTLNSARIATNSITGSHILFDQAFFNSFMANEAYLQQLFAKNAFITQVQAVTLSASKISGGTLTATNGAMGVNLNAGQILYYTDQAALKRVLSGYPTQFIKFGTGTQSTDNAFRLIGAGSSSSIGASIASFGTNRNNGENNLDGGFTGVNIYSGGTTGTNVVDRIELASDILQIAHAASTGIANDPRGWTFENQNSVNNNYVFRPNTSPNSAYKALIGTSVTPINELYIDEAYIKGQRLGWILKDIANRVGHGGWANYIS